MLFPKIWVKDFDPQTSSKPFACWGWSDLSEDEARAHARERSARVAAAFKNRTTDRLNRYGYGTRALREQVLETIPSLSPHADPASSAPAAVITRNAHGCLVLNTSRTMFVDIDLPILEEPESTGGFFGLFAKKTSHQQQAIDTTLQRIETWTRNHPDWNWRVYRTRAGLRLIATHDLFEPIAAASGPIFNELGADPLYQKLCVNQASFRARLTPKPWRIAHYPPNDQWPFANLAVEQSFAEWLCKYEAASEKFATCQFLRPIGCDRTHPEAARIIALHDQATKTAASLPLA